MDSELAIHRLLLFLLSISLIDATVSPMTPFQSLLSALTLDALSGFDRESATEAGLSSAKITAWEDVHAAYFGPTRYRRLQHEAVRRARAGQFTLDQLVLIEQRLRPVKSKEERMRLRVALLERRQSFTGLQALATQLVPKVEQPPQERVTFSKSRMGMATVTLTTDERLLGDLKHAVTRNLDPRQPASSQMAAKFAALLRGGAADEGAARAAGGVAVGAVAGAAAVGVAEAIPRPTIIIPLDAHTKILQGDGDDIILGLTDGTTTTGAQYLAKYHAQPLEVALFHPQAGPVNLYRTQRFANRKQRDLAKLTTPVCPVPGCHQGADFCEAHHVSAWKHGGKTNLDNLVMLCRYHNRVNDDDGGAASGAPRAAPGGAASGGSNPGRGRGRGRGRRRGRIEMIRGRPTWVSPRGYPVPNTYHPYGAMELLFGDKPRGPG